jgi:hemerythrin-like domain-containing protein
MNPIDELKTEHRAIERALDLLARLAGGIEASGGNGRREDARRLVEFFKLFADTCHHGKEEGLLFPVLERIGVSRQGGPIGVMLAEHDRGRAQVQVMEAALTGLSGSDASAAARFREAARDYADLLRQHIYKEDHVLFEIAEQRLSKTQQNRLSEQFERFERDVMGPGRHDAIHRMLDDLGRRYSDAMS